ncbi:2-hydroxy-6-oxo-6-(2'-aminophenyl)hexa-2,4-dienoic acid hydrolase [Sesamum alatum]|uniref:2-hydroxy-6-oxo-6-(2'-aminophenyl)hexa-2, 4-dienoic acid hydrolase n=1 Tax=Sesamum alatum TaxID=300844 RepID=A0AAE2CRB5_9LAMI|nr:2-hydroxy-6-oxo-6-(2'-aminophenyl)hexa-2,4-dienoic acid hydrolase [Sesamum alatum]
MALLFLPRLFTVSMSPKRAFFAPKAPLRFSASAVDVRVESGAAASSTTAILWYKHDLRVEDHPGLVAASQHRCVVPLYVFDRRILSRFSDEMLELLLFALEDLRKLLNEQGSNLMIRFGRAENVIGELVKEVQASSIFAEEEVEYELRIMLDIVKESLSTLSLSRENTKIVTWNAPFYDVKSLADLPSSYNDFKKLNLPVVSPIVPPKLSGNLMNLSWGTLPTLADLKEYMDDISDGGNNKEEWTSIKSLSPENLLQRNRLRGNVELKPPELKKENQLDSDSKTIRRKKPKKSAFVTSQGSFVGGGSSLVLNALAGYLRYLEGTARDEWQEVHEKLRLSEQREGASFQALFGSALLLGIISRRRVYDEAIKYEKERNGGFLSPFGYSTTTVAAAINTVSSMEWYWLLNLKCQKNKAGNFSIRIWRWNNYLIQYTTAGHEGPAILLVHGFGAFLEHYRDNVYPIAEAGNRVWAITLVGFGKSEKPNIIYTELVWAELLRDFIIEVIGEPAHLVGNSIGGYSVAIVAGIWSSLAKSVVLMNTAGNIIPGYSALGYSEDRRTSGAVWLGARLLLVYLRFNIRNILRSFYPTNTDRADDQLINEMIRASYDPGVIFVLESIFSFDLSLALNYLLEGFEKKILVIQGMKDPLSDSKSMLAMFREHCKGIAIKEVIAGHCPHDELPNEVNAIIMEWVVTLENEGSPVAVKQLQQ